MRRWTRALPILALGAAALGVAAPANAGTAPVLQFAARACLTDWMLWAPRTRRCRRE